MERDPIGSDARQATRERSLGPEAVCVLCGEVDVAVLRRVDATPFKAALDKVHPGIWTLFERDHVAGRAHDAALTLVLCRNCHGKLTFVRMAAGISMQSMPTALERNMLILRGLALFFPKLGATCDRMADELERQVAGLDRDQKNWRSHAWAK